MCRNLAGDFQDSALKLLYRSVSVGYSLNNRVAVTGNMLNEDELWRFSQEELIHHVQRLQHEKLTLLHEHGSKMKVGLQYG